MILVTGSTGSIGRPLVELLTTQGAEVRGNGSSITQQPFEMRLPQRKRARNELSRPPTSKLSN